MLPAACIHLSARPFPGCRCRRYSWRRAGPRLIGAAVFSPHLGMAGIPLPALLQPCVMNFEKEIPDIEAKLLIGRYLQLKPRPPDPYAGCLPFLTMLCVRPDNQESTRFAGSLGGHFGQRASAVVPAQPNANKMHRNFQMVALFEGDISAPSRIWTS